MCFLTLKPIFGGWEVCVYPLKRMAQSQKQKIRTQYLCKHCQMHVFWITVHTQDQALIRKSPPPHTYTFTSPELGPCTWRPLFSQRPQPQAQAPLRALTLDKVLQSWHGSHKPLLQTESQNLHHLLCRNCEQVLSAQYVQGNLTGLISQNLGPEEVLVATAWAQGVLAERARRGVLKLGITGWAWRSGGLQAVPCAACAYSQLSVKRAKPLEPTCTPRPRAHEAVLRLFERRLPPLLRFPSSTPAPSPVSTAGMRSSCQAAQGCCSCLLLPFLLNTGYSGSRLKWNTHIKTPTENTPLKFPVIVSLGSVSKYFIGVSEEWIWKSILWIPPWGRQHDLCTAG